ncbi:MAG: hypothetical protein WCT04_24780 [Planctomycetota bacterium]
MKSYVAIAKTRRGRGWEVSKLEGLKGTDFLAGVEKCADAAKYTQVEHLRWLASALSAKDRAAAVIKIAHSINDSITIAKTDLTASLKPDEAEADPGLKHDGKTSSPKEKQPGADIAQSSAPIKAGENNVIYVDAAAFAQTGGQISWGGQTPHVLVHDCFTGGKQVYFQQQMKSQWADYSLDVPVTGTYVITMKAACINVEQVLEVLSGKTVLATVPIELSYGLWQETKPVELKLSKGVQILRVQTPQSINAENHKRGIALRSFELKPKK